MKNKKKSDKKFKMIKCSAMLWQPWQKNSASMVWLGCQHMAQEPTIPHMLVVVVVVVWDGCDAAKAQPGLHHGDRAYG